MIKRMNDKTETLRENSIYYSLSSSGIKNHGVQVELVVGRSRVVWWLYYATGPESEAITGESHSNANHYYTEDRWPAPGHLCLSRYLLMHWGRLIIRNVSLSYSWLVVLSLKARTQGRV